MSRCSKKIPTLKLGCKGLDAGLRAAEDQGVDVVRAFVGIDHLQFDDVADDAELVGDAVAAEHIAGDARNVERLAARVALHDRGDLDRGAALVLHAPEAQAALQAEGDLGLHVGELLLDQLVRGERPAEDRKSTRLNSSHLVISYAVFCLKKKSR